MVHYYYYIFDKTQITSVRIENIIIAFSYLKLNINIRDTKCMENIIHLYNE